MKVVKHEIKKSTRCLCCLVNDMKNKNKTKKRGRWLTLDAEQTLNITAKFWEAHDKSPLAKLATPKIVKELRRPSFFSTCNHASSTGVWNGVKAASVAAIFSKSQIYIFPTTSAVCSARYFREHVTTQKSVQGIKHTSAVGRVSAFASQRPLK